MAKEAEGYSPHSSGSERYIITCCLNDKDAILELAGKLSPEDFFHELYKYTYKICAYFAEREMVAEPMAIYNQLEKFGVAEPANLKELELLSKASFDLKNLGEAVEEVLGCSARRQLIEVSKNNAVTLEKMEGALPEKAVAVCEEGILSVANKLANVNDVYKLGDDALEVLMARADAPQHIPGLPTGFAKLDEELMGMEPGRMYVIAARLKTGKSIFLANVAAHVALELGVPVLMIDTENQSSMIEDRLLSLISGVEEQLIRNGMFAKNPESSKRVREAVEKLEKSNLYHHYMPNFTFEACLGLIKRYKVQKGIGLVVFDYIKSSEGSAFHDIREDQSLGYLADGLHNRVAGALDIPVLTACQLGRAGGDENTNESHVADSDRISRYTDVLMTLREKSDGEKEKFGSNKYQGNMVLQVQANRGGPAKEFAHDVWFDKPVMKMTEVKSRRLG